MQLRKRLARKVVVLARKVVVSAASKAFRILPFLDEEYETQL